MCVSGTGLIRRGTWESTRTTRVCEQGRRTAVHPAHSPAMVPTSTTSRGALSATSCCSSAPLSGPTNGMPSRLPHRSSRRTIQSSFTSCASGAGGATQLTSRRWERQLAWANGSLQYRQCSERLDG